MGGRVGEGKSWERQSTWRDPSAGCRTVGEIGYEHVCVQVGLARVQQGGCMGRKEGLLFWLRN